MAGDVANVVKGFKKNLGDNSVIMGDTITEVERLSTGIFELDFMLGGGLPRGRVTEIFGVPGACKTNIVMKTLAAFQRNFPGLKNGWIAVEPFDALWAKRLGVKIEDLYVVNPDYSEQVIDFAEGLIAADDCGMVILDSFAAMTTQAELEKSGEENDPGKSGMVGKKLFNKIVAAQRATEKDGRTASTFICINQMRHKIGVMFGSPETTPGGFAPEHNAALRLRMYAKDIMDKTVSTTVAARKEIHIVVKKKKIPVAAQECKFEMAVIPQDGLKVGDVYYWKSLSYYLEKHGILTKDGKIFKLGDDQFSTLTAIKDKIAGDRELYDMLTQTLIRAEVDLIYDGINIV